MRIDEIATVSAGIFGWSLTVGVFWAGAFLGVEGPAYYSEWRLGKRFTVQPPKEVKRG